MEIKIDEKLQDLIPHPTPEALKQLEENVVTYGCRDALIVAEDGTLVDGHNRYSICTKHGIPFKTETMHFDSREDMIIFICKNQADEPIVSTYGDSAETIAICGLLHDVCKANFYKATTRNVKNDETGKWEKVPYYSIEEKFPFGHGEKSVFLIERFMKLTPEEAVAIRFHMGEFEKERSTSDAYSKYPLAVMLHVSDLLATYMDEKEE